jgi:hypothetical protein
MPNARGHAVGVPWGPVVVIVALFAWALPSAARASVTEPNGTAVPIHTSNGETQLDTFLATNDPALNALTDAQSGPGTFYPPPTGGSITFKLNEASSHFGLAWYNVTGTKPGAADLHEIIPPSASVNASVAASAIRNDPAWAGGLIGFALESPQTHYSQMQFDVVCTTCSPNAPWITALEYTSTLQAQSAYLAFIDANLTAAQFQDSGDFNDDVFLLTGFLPAECVDTIDNDADGNVDTADRGCWSGPAGAYNPEDNDESDAPLPPAVTLPSSPIVGAPSAATPVTATVTQAGTGVSSCTLALDTGQNGAFATALTTTVATGPPVTCSAAAPSGLAPGDYAVKATYTETFGTVTTATGTVHIIGKPANMAAPAITGTANAGSPLKCGSGTWTNSPAFTYAWFRNGTPLLGATSATYTAQQLDEGSVLTCTVTASNAAGSGQATSGGVKIPFIVVKGCPAATGHTSGTTLGVIHLGVTRAQARHAFTHSSKRNRAYEDFFCLTPRGLRTGYASPKLMKTLSKRLSTQWAGKVVWISSANPIYAVEGVRPGATLAAAQKILGHGNQYQVGKNDWFLAPAGAATAMLKVRSGVIDEVGIAVKALTQGRKAQHNFVTSFS